VSTSIGVGIEVKGLLGDRVEVVVVSVATTIVVEVGSVSDPLGGCGGGTIFVVTVVDKGEVFISMAARFVATTVVGVGGAGEGDTSP
jgi:hypothetical protein